MRKARGYREAIAARLRDLIEARGKTVASVERELGRRRGYLGDALRGEKRLTLEALLEILDHLGETPRDFFARALPGSAAAEVREPPAEEAAPEPERATALRLTALIQVLDRRGLVDRQELQAAVDRLRAAGRAAGR
jgi:transcriptional regulator with XRE-family HTH domain